MKIVFEIILFLIFLKLLLFWLWLWQLKEYHLGRFKAHFTTQTFKKIIVSFWRLKYPKFTKKIIIILLTSLFLAVFLFAQGLHFFIFLLIVLVPLFFQIPAVAWRQRMIQKAKQKRAKFKNLLVIGITGSYGKTSTKEFLATILSEKFNVLKTSQHHNSEIGISQCILNSLKSEHEIFVVEMAAYNKGGIKLLSDIVKPKIGMITGVNEQHLALFGSMENLLSAEGGKELIENLLENGLIFFNAKNKYCRDLYQETPHQNKFAAGQAKIKKFLYGENAPLLLENLEGAKMIAKELGMTDEEIEKAVEKIESQLPGIQLKKGVNGLNIIDAVYSANPTGVMAHLEYLKTFSGKKIIIMLCLIELGRASQEVHRKIGEKIAEVCDLAIITTKDYFKEIKQNAPHALLIEDPQKILKKIRNFCQPGDTILLENRLPSEIINSLLK